MATVARIKKDGSLHLKSEINERLPVVTDGLVAYYPLDSQAGGVDVIVGNGTVQNLEDGINILDCLSASWRNPINWGIWGSGSGYGVWDETEQAMRFDSYNFYTLQIPIPIDTSKNWYIEATMKQGSGAGGTMYLGTISYDASMSVLPGHPGTYDYFGATGPSVPTTWTIYKNTQIGGTPRTGESSDSNYATWHTGTKFARILIITNYSEQPGPTWVKNLKFYHVDANTSNTIVTEDGIAIQEATTNLVPTPTIFSSGWSPYNNGWDGAFMTEFGVEGANVINRQSWCGLVRSITAAAGTYTLSVYVKLIGRTNTAVGVTLYTSGGGISDTAVSADWSKQGQWQRIEMTRTYTSANFSLYLICFGGVDDPAYKVTCQYTKPQIELRSFSTAFVNGSKSDGILHIPISSVLNNTTASINFDYYNYYGISSTIISGSIVQNSPPNGAWWGIYRDSSGNVYNHWLDGSSSSTGVPQTINTWSNYTLSWNASYEYLYINGVFQYQKAKSANLPTNQLPTISLGFGWSRGDGKFKNLKIYNKALSATEIKELAGEGFKLTTSRATTPLLVESPLIPLDAYYFPLASDTKDSSRTIDATQKDNVSFEDSSAWIGTATTDVYGNFVEYTALSYDIINTNLKWIRLKSTSWCGRFEASIASSGVYTLSIWYKGGAFQIDNDGVDDNTFNHTFSSSTTWTKYTPQQTFTTTGTHYLYFRATTSTSVEIRKVQLEKKTYPNAFVNGSRGATVLTYNLNTTIGLDWSGNWTICNWKKPIATGNDALTGYNISQIGRDGAPTSTGIIWYGKTNGSNDLYLAGSGLATGIAIPDINSYFNNWQFEVLTKNGSTVTYKCYLTTGVLTLSGTASIGSANAMVANNMDLNLGGFNASNASNAYYSDLIVVKRALSDSELINIYKQFSIYKTKVNTQNLIEEGL